MNQNDRSRYIQRAGEIATELCDEADSLAENMAEISEKDPMRAFSNIARLKEIYQETIVLKKIAHALMESSIFHMFNEDE